MRIVPVVAFVGLVFTTPVLAQVTVEVNAPTIAFESAPPLVEIAPGVQVVPDLDDEVFFVDGYYWTRRGDHWFRTKDYRGGWIAVRDKDVPPVLLGMPRGKYKRFKRHRDHEQAQAANEEARERAEREREREHKEKARERDERAREHEEKAREHEEKARERDERAREHEERAEEARERRRDRENNRAERSRTQNPRSGPEHYPGKNEISVHLGYQEGFAGKFANPSGFKLFFEYARRLSDVVWLDLQANNVFGFGPGEAICYDRLGRPFPCNLGYYYGGWDFEFAIGVKLKIKTKIPLVVEIPILAAVEVLYDRQCGDTGAAPALRVGGGVKYFVTRSIGVGGGINFAFGPGFHAASACFDSYTDFYGAVDFQLGAEFIF
jgi:hypothetical protein